MFSNIPNSTLIFYFNGNGFFQTLNLNILNLVSISQYLIALSQYLMYVFHMVTSSIIYNYTYRLIDLSKQTFKTIALANDGNFARRQWYIIMRYILLTAEVRKLPHSFVPVFVFCALCVLFYDHSLLIENGKT